MIKSTEPKVIEGLQKEQKLILLLTLSGCKFEGKSFAIIFLKRKKKENHLVLTRKNKASKCVFPSDGSMVLLQDAIRFCKRYLFQSVEFPDGKVAADFLHRQKPVKAPKTKKPVMQVDGKILSDNDDDETQGYDDMDGFIVRGRNGDDESDMSSSSEEEENMSDGGTTRTKRHKSQSRSQHKKKKRRRLYRNDEDETTVARRQKERQEKELRQYKSADYVHDSDDELTPEELAAFFESEQRIREKFNAADVYYKVEKEREEQAEALQAKEKLRRQQLDMDSDIEMQEVVSENDDDSDIDKNNDNSKDQDDDEMIEASDSSNKDESSSTIDTEKELHSRNYENTDPSSLAKTGRPRKMIADSDDEE